MMKVPSFLLNIQTMTSSQLRSHYQELRQFLDHIDQEGSVRHDHLIFNKYNNEIESFDQLSVEILSSEYYYSRDKKIVRTWYGYRIYPDGKTMNLYLYKAYREHEKMPDDKVDVSLSEQGSDVAEWLNSVSPLLISINKTNLKRKIKSL